jgi:Tfp pilus assembly PilM family ATPase
MPQLVALEWDSREIRLMVASGRGRQVVIEQAFAVPFESDGAEDALNAQGDSPDTKIGIVPERIGRQIAAELQARGLAAADAVVAVGRNSIELRQLQLPPATDEDLPELVRFQAMREFNELDDAWRLDFVPIEGDANTSRTVLATAIAPSVLAQCEAVCQYAGLKMRRLLLRPCEAALLLKGEESIPRGQAALLVDFLGGEAELTAAVDGTAVFLHTARLSGDPPPAQALLAAIRLTMAAAFNQTGGRRIESIVLCGLPQSHLELACALEDELALPVKLVDPFRDVKLGRALVLSPPEHPGRFAPLVGMLLAELRPGNHAVDFLHPRRRAETADPRKKWAIAGIAAAVLLVAWFVYARVDQFRLAARVEQLQQQSREMDKRLDDAKRAQAASGEIIRWADEEVNWLDRFYALNQGFPPAKVVVLDEASVNSGASGGEMELKGWVAQPDDMARLADGVRAHGYQMSQKSSGDNRTVPPYTCYFEAAVLPEKPAKKD